MNAESKRTTYAEAVAGYDEAFEHHLAEVIVRAIAEASIVTDADVMALRTGETVAALTTVMAGMLAMSPAVARSPTAIRKATDPHSPDRRRD